MSTGRVRLKLYLSSSFSFISKWPEIERDSDSWEVAYQVFPNAIKNSMIRIFGQGNISSADIFNALFSARNRIFSPFSAYVFGARDNEAATIAETTTVLTVRNPSSPFIIGSSSLVFFWERPSETEDCVNYIVSNEKDVRVGFCKSQLESCSRSIRDLYKLAGYEFSSPTGISFADFSWFCLRGAACCEWESRLLNSFMKCLRKTLVVIDILLIIIVGLPLLAMPQPYDGMDIRKYAWMKDLKGICTAKGSFTINHKTGRLEKKEEPYVFKANEPEDPSYWAACTIL
ncbi:hypothetical protein PRIPAC_72317 [Pristionchus pacificus]|uniref:Uncharacterized protein n=1 Tax=Pristionchus pacificus TaxID=54126 RepID=A0A2A6C8L8_PRIPA|nr:hypothetical protein PRIPAC_72317 [Pristionchus pacificus]|eukprot:PDM74552.1 hypothetical protein PRIPAC_41908 [Pristionchus pacificus]